MLKKNPEKKYNEWGAWYIKGYNDYCGTYWHNGQEFEALCGILEKVQNLFDLSMVYNPPSDPQSKVEYDSGWNKAKKIKIKKVLEGIGGILGACIEFTPPKS